MTYIYIQIHYVYIYIYTYTTDLSRCCDGRVVMHDDFIPKAVETAFVLLTLR